MKDLLCGRCGAANVWENKVCGRCGASLPVVFDEKDAPRRPYEEHKRAVRLARVKLMRRAGASRLSLRLGLGMLAALGALAVLASC